MAKTAVAQESVDETPKVPKFLPSTASGIDESGLRWEEVSVFGTTYRVREITVEEGDTAYDAAVLPPEKNMPLGSQSDKFNPRLDSRLRLCSAIVSPPTSIDDIGRWSGAKLAALLYIYDRVNALPAADSEGNG